MQDEDELWEQREQELTDWIDEQIERELES
jgi:hypothetical protein